MWFILLIAVSNGLIVYCAVRHLCSNLLTDRASFVRWTKAATMIIAGTRGPVQRLRGTASSIMLQPQRSITNWACA